MHYTEPLLQSTLQVKEKSRFKADHTNLLTLFTTHGPFAIRTFIWVRCRNHLVASKTYVEWQWITTWSNNESILRNNCFPLFDIPSGFKIAAQLLISFHYAWQTGHFHRLMNCVVSSRCAEQKTITQSVSHDDGIKIR